jgi:acyl-CoA synthetase (AMP-forming)/AMP-acid ligase II
VADAAVMTASNALSIEQIYALVQTSQSFEESTLRLHCETKLARSFVPVRFIAIDRIPRNEIGEIERTELHHLAKLKLG